MLTMARKAIRSDYENVLLTNVPEKLLEARNIVRDVPNEILDFCEFLATVVNKDLIPVGLIRSLNYALDDIIEETCNFSRAKSLPDVVKRKKYDILKKRSGDNSARIKKKEEKPGGHMRSKYENGQ